MRYAKQGQTINEYGSGTGRPVMAIRRRGNYKINMVDIAENALEDQARAALGDDLTFTQAALWELPAGFPHADWGYCVDVLMTVPPEKLDAILQEIARTCKNFFCQVYDWPDVRIDIDFTTIKEGPEWWAEKLGQYWKHIRRLESPEHSHRYIFVCTEQPDTKEFGSIMALKNAYPGETAWIVGRGPSLLNVAKETFGAGPVICLNESIINISRMRLPNDVYTLWRNGDVLPDLPKYGAAMILCENQVLSDPPSAKQFTDYHLRYTFECKRDLGCDPPATFTHKAALEIAVLMGCSKVVMIGFDSCTTGDQRTVLEDDYVQSEHRPGAYNEQGEIVKARIRELGIPVEWITPQQPTGPIRLNLGCGELYMLDYINIDLHAPQADVRMDVRKLDYADGSVTEIHASHLLEHFGHYEIAPLLKEWFRVLKDGGMLNLVVPNLEWCLQNWLSTDDDKKDGLALKMIFGLQSNEGEYHKTGFTWRMLDRQMRAAGFNGMRIADLWDEPHKQRSYYVSAMKGAEDSETVFTSDPKPAEPQDKNQTKGAAPSCHSREGGNPSSARKGGKRAR